MMSIARPGDSELHAFRDAQAAARLTYLEVGATAFAGGSEATRAKFVRPGFNVDHTRQRLGEGETIFQTAKTALQHWQQFRIGWLEAWPQQTPLRAGEVVAIVARAFGLWWVNACRITYVVDEERRFGFAYGTLPDHVGTGEERFLVEWNADNSVWYDILAFSRPNQLLAWMGYPLLRRNQRCFGRQSATHMLALVRAQNSA